MIFTHDTLYEMEREGGKIGSCDIIGFSYVCTIYNTFSFPDPALLLHIVTVNYGPIARLFTHLICYRSCVVLESLHYQFLR